MTGAASRSDAMQTPKTAAAQHLSVPSLTSKQRTPSQMQYLQERFRNS